MKKKKWRNRKGAGLLALALTFALALSGTGAFNSQAAGAVEVNRTDCELTVDADDLYRLVQGETGNSYVPGAPDDAADLPNYSESKVKVHLYKVADIDAGGAYTAVNEPGGFNFSALDDDFEQLNSTTSAETWLEMAEEAEAVVWDSENAAWADTSLTGETDADSHTVHFTGLPVGLYLVAAKMVRTDNYVYSFTPYLVSLPNHSYYEDGNDNWEYEAVVGLKAEQTPRTGKLTIEKELNGHNGMPGNSATFVFKLTITSPKDMPAQKVTEQRIESIFFDGITLPEKTVENIPAGSTVVVEEIYAGAGYEIADGSQITQTVTVTADDQYNEPGETVDPIVVSFTNQPDGTTTGGYGIENHFNKTETGYDEPEVTGDADNAQTE